MCCAVATVFLIGPRAGILVWWLFASERFSEAFSTVLVPLAGFLLAPWTTLAYLLVFRGGVEGLDWIWIVIGVLADLSSYGGGARSRA